MKRFVAVAMAGFILSVSLAVAVNAAPAGKSGQTGQTESRQGIKNAKKAMQSRFARDKQMREVKKRGYAKRQQAQSGN